MPKTKYSNEFLNEMRMQGDPLADAAAEVLWKNPDCGIIDDLRRISQNHHLNLRDNINSLDNYHSQSEENDLELIEKYFIESEKIGETFTDQDKEYFKISAEIFDRYGYFMTFILFFKSLPTGYMCPNPAEVLHTTKLLERFAARRVMETAQFVFAVNKANWYEPGNDGLEIIQKVRLMHAGMRISILRRTEGQKWEAENINNKIPIGVPINQEDLALTNHLFSLAVIEGLDQLGVHLTKKERFAVFHTWQKIGLALGISEELIVTDYAEAWRQYRQILNRGIGKKNASGPSLTKALHDSMNKIMGVHISLKHLQHVTMYFLMDKRMTSSLNLHHPSFLETIFAKILHFILSWRIWQWLFHHKRNNVFMNVVNRAVNYVLTKRFNLGSILNKHKDLTPLKAFSLLILKKLHTADKGAFDRATTEQRRKMFFSDSRLIEMWGLNGFDLDEVEIKKIA